MATLKELNSQLSAAQKKHGAKSQAAGRIQYKINQLNKGSKGTAVKSKTGVVKSKTGVVRQTDATKKKRTVTKRKTPLTGSPSAGTAKKKAPDMYNEAVALDKKKKTVTITGLNGKKKTVASGSGKLIDVKSEGSIKTKTGSARGGDRFGPNAAKNKRIAELERLLEEEKKKQPIRTRAR